MPRKQTTAPFAGSQAPSDPAVATLSPLDVMLRAMRAYVACGDWDKATSLAKDVAPYVHPKLAALRQSADYGATETLDLSHATEEQLATLEQIFGPLAQDFDDACRDDGDEGDTNSAER